MVFWRFDQDSILSQSLELDQYQPIEQMASFYFNEIELGHECDPDLQLCDWISIFESMLILISLPKFDPFSEPILIPVPIDFELEPPTLDSHIPLLEMNLKFNSLIWTKLLNQVWLLNPNLILVNYLSQHWFLFLSFPSPINYNTKSHSIIGPRYRQLCLRMIF